MNGKITLNLPHRFMWNIKRYLAIPLFFVYFFAVTGVVIQNTCCVDENQMTMATQAPSGCCHPKTSQKHNSTVSEKNHCCHHTAVVVKTIHYQIVNHADFSILKQLQQALAHTFFNYDDVILPSDVRLASNLANAPPGFWQTIPLYKLHQRFTFYG